MNGCIDCGKSWPLTAQQHFRPDFSSKSKYEGWSKFPLLSFSDLREGNSLPKSREQVWDEEAALMPIPNKAPRSRELQIQERMRRTAAWSGDKVREGKTSRRSLPWPVVLSFTGLPRYLARMANSGRDEVKHGMAPEYWAVGLMRAPDKTRAKQKSWVGHQQTFKILKRVCAGRKISLSSFLITARNPNNIIKIYL